MATPPPHSLAGLTLRDLDYVLAVSRTGHFGRAARLCGVSQPGLSEQIRKVEALLGCALFERGRRGARPTQRGATLIPLVERIVRDAHVLMEQAHGTGHDLSGSLALGIIPTLAPYYMPTLLRRIRAAHPDIALRLTEDRTPDLARHLLDYTLDIAIAAMPVTDAGIAAAPLFFEPFRVLLPRAHPLAARSALSSADLDGAALILLDPGHCLRDQTVSLCSPATPPHPDPDGPFATSVEMLRYMVDAGEGIAVMPALAVDTGTEARGFSRAVPFASPEIGRTIGLWWRATDPRAPLFENLARELGAQATP
ncbi:oxidative stress regulatory protein OxyR [Gluconacetobacter sacchari DSM 12717]|uniref:Hydrogen peroxide-inducible genes activator n=2 Tax=Gluconacetobacter sacchari TaxID=92759 RepID=A0A7W4IC36_9PROT|nr:hydrogen peroxide-inducible genes activator [Gluconacetobacter sacchari]MBB2160067.1 hydrogen peroxide-inducible genes activator [Gluconacetobacter sacchari]GBQ19965.1 oxidative stress regulatory protein OxyR [Gluconacetobacter sacchari DSM 12717]